MAAAAAVTMRRTMHWRHRVIVAAEPPPQLLNSVMYVCVRGQFGESAAEKIVAEHTKESTSGYIVLTTYTSMGLTLTIFLITEYIHENRVQIIMVCKYVFSFF